eukprot:gnl/TRDRNA2_/TRDRNA2_177799_c4_seq12.p1 gnl/TRDRNA2_/TRDRNA2_177799_c4~~gnl/TRDRNA2_/TRDRNA2_177799_c4_seq12.p1  ORF type:complete len:361 (-),score=57.66 gnl/TRDRNA2_/TRDRNA2_177799_c4_seq12:231-1313(-)
MVESSVAAKRQKTSAETPHPHASCQADKDEPTEVALKSHPNAGTHQGVTDLGSVPHSPTLYMHASLAEGMGTLPTSDKAPAIEVYRRDGFVVFEKAFTAEEVSAQCCALRGLMDGSNESFANAVLQARCVDTSKDRARGGSFPSVQYEAGTKTEGGRDVLFRAEVADRIRKLSGFIGHSDTLDAVARDSRLLSLVAALLDCDVGEIELFQDMALLKPAGGGREKPWHQDKAYFDVGVEIPVVGCWIAIDETTCENGCMRMLRGGHRAGPKMHFAKRDYQICDSDAPSSKNGDDVVAVPLPQGGLVMFDGMLPHGTPTNQTDTRRRALQFHWLKRGAPRIAEDAKGGRVEIFGGSAHGLSC